MDQWHPRTLAAEPRPSAQTEHFSEFNAASRQIPQQRGHLHKQLYGSSQKSATNTTSNHTSKHLHRPNQTNQRQQLYQPPAIIKQLERSKQSKLTAPPAATTIKQNCADRHLRGAYQDESIRNDTCLADQLPFARTQRKILAFFYIYAIVVASLFLTYVAYCFVQSHQWRRNQQQQSRSVSSSSAPLRAAPDEFSELQSARQAIELEAKFESRLALLERYIEIMAADLEETKVRLREREKCRCHIGCSVNGTQYDDGANWQRQQTCDNCSCQSGKVTCTPIKCPKLSCDPSEQVQASGKCCPLCMKKCKHNNSFIKHNQVFYPPPNENKAGPRKQCKCQDGLIKCELVSPKDQDGSKLQLIPIKSQAKQQQTNVIPTMGRVVFV